MQFKYPKVLIYKRTHTGDPGPEGVFGIHDCMGSVRGRQYDAVIGIGGVRPWRGDEGIAYKINWIGIGTQKGKIKGRGPLVTFDKFVLFDDKGPLLKELAPKLYNYMYIDAHRRLVMSSSLPKELQEEINTILNLVKNSSPSSGASGLSSKCISDHKIKARCR